MRKQLLTLAACLLLVSITVAFAQDEAESTDLVVEEVEIVEQQDIYGQVVQVAEGLLVNNGDQAYTDISLSAALYNEDDEQVGEGFGFLVDACAAGLLPGFALQPGHSQPFTVPLELYELDTSFDRIEVMPQASPTDPVDAEDSSLQEGILQVTDQEAIEVQWDGPRSLRYAIGCDRDLFTDWQWYRLSTLSGDTLAIEHPSADAVTDELRAALGLEDPLLFANSFLRFAPDGSRIVYQDAVNRMYTASANGTLQRLVHGRLNNRTLQGIYWLDDNRFLAYYYGAYGDSVIYFTADVEGRHISPAPLDNPESVIVPGASADARRVILGGTFDEGTGYYIHVVTNGFFELLFRAELPGNNWPGPIAIVDPEEDVVVRVYVARPFNGAPTLQCYNREQDVHYSLATLPLNLTEGDRARWWISPDEQMIALAASGINGGLWTIDLSAMPPCQ